MNRLAIFASGTGSNAAKIIDYFDSKEDIRVELIVSNRSGAGVLKIADRHSVPTLILSREAFYHSNQILFDLQQRQINWIILAGFLWLIPAYLVQSYRSRIINIHPALLPKYGGKGMYGKYVHEAVFKSGETETGITIHFVNEQYDEGQIIYQARCQVEETDTPQSIQGKVQALEHKHFAPVIEKLLRKEKIADRD
ncbi:MAG: phosphoribosylglycinamide formyltransferase [Saprospiraceae bacterium]|nr:phosphoribosylglycinamide formyltransferase [Saprospiraceae bacterium]